MAENTVEEHLNDPTNNQSESLSDHITAAIDTETITQNQATETMEVHAHDLHKAPGHGWKHYAFEFSLPTLVFPYPGTPPVFDPRLRKKLILGVKPGRRHTEAVMERGTSGGR